MKIGRRIIPQRYLYIGVAIALVSAGVREGGAGLTIALDGEPSDTVISVTFSGSGTLIAGFGTFETLSGNDLFPGEYVSNTAYEAFTSIFQLTNSTVTLMNLTQGWSSPINTISFDNDTNEIPPDPGGELIVPLFNGNNIGLAGDSYVFSGTANLDLDPFNNTGFTFADFVPGTYAADDVVAFSAQVEVLDEMILEVVPEPNSLMLFGLGLGVLGWFRRRDSF